MRRNDLLRRAEELRVARTPYLLATVVRAQRPTSTKPGDCALVLADGTLDGFVGGNCAESAVRRHGLRLLETGESTLLRLVPSAGDAPPPEEGLLVVSSECLSGGSLDIFLEPVLPAPLIHVYGESPVARALEAIGNAAGYEMSRHPLDTLTPLPAGLTAIVIASHGSGEEPLLEAALRSEVPYIALVASQRRGQAVLSAVGATRDRVRTPAGLDLGARTPSEVAICVLAELIATRSGITVGCGPASPAGEPIAPVSKRHDLADDRPGPPESAVTPPAAGAPAGAGGAPGAETSGRAGRFGAAPSLFQTAARRVLPVIQPATAVDPVCRTEVTVSPTTLHAEHEGQKYYFCGPGCQAAFHTGPHRQVAPS